MSELDNLIRQAIAAEADERVDPRTVLAELHRRRRRPLGLIIAAGATAAAVAIAVALIVPRTTPTVNNAAPPAGTPQTALLIGLDDHAHADAIVLARVGADGELSAVSLPRDSLVDVEGHGLNRLNAAYAIAHQEAKGEDPDEAGARSLVKTVEQVTGTKIDHYAAVKMSSFGQVASALGGVDVCLTKPARDHYSGVDLPAGEQTLSGDQALAFLRQRFGLDKGDLDRVARQQAFLASVAAKLVRSPDKLDDLVRAVGPHVRVDSGWDVLAFVKRMTPGSAVRMGTIPVGTPSNETPGLPLDLTAVREFVAKFPAEGAPTGGTPGKTTACVS
ncbi:LytR family transcriptional regulator [Lentzea tibetensis]|uniref:LytR family transcriptional regulator n=1 Tax=Lentzea tibetensis TaxID=2591470 RepID=A0A563EYF9_9PSEU|nr:LCP family protein [Lentzea tibetensis]TWP52709.1 LytR family transcriptional regulator [Lentzea tibetensis]